MDFPVKSVDLSVGLNEVGDSGQSTTHPECHTAVIEIAFPQGLTHFDDQGANQSNWVKYRVGFKRSDEASFRPLPRGTQGYAGDDHLSFVGLTSDSPVTPGPGTPPGGGTPTNPDGSLKYEPLLYFDTDRVGFGESLVVKLSFFGNSNIAWHGNGYTPENPDRPKESFWWENADTGEIYQQTNTHNGLASDPFDPNKWGYDQEAAFSWLHRR